jgi:hypothetical protein
LADVNEKRNAILCMSHDIYVRQQEQSVIIGPALIDSTREDYARRARLPA